MNLAAYDNETFRIIRTLGPVEAEAALEAMRTLAAFHNDQQMFLIVRMNRIALASADAQYLAELTESHGMGPSRLSFAALDLNRHLLNLLSSFVGFIDHAEVALRRRFGNDSAEFKCFKTATSDQYDDVFAYRFLYRLRNHALHFELPLHHFQASSDASDPAAPSDELTFGIDASRLRRNPHWGAMRTELETMGVISVQGLLDEMLQCVDSLHALKLDLDAVAPIPALTLLEDLAREASAAPGHPFLIPEDFMREPDRQYRMHAFPLDIMLALRAGLDADQVSRTDTPSHP